ncbi:MAG: serine/threonine protein kinase [Cyanobacteria bacterium SZAS LIN-5]|nr:serine/threonine protein kinase [Cyanobacteria bacterium SZAS LIN-5]
MDLTPADLKSSPAISTHPLQNSTFVGGRYEIIDLIGQGGAGAVYRVRHQALNKIFALKALYAGVTTDEKALRRFDAEAKTVGNLNNPYLIQVHDYGVTDSGIPYIVLDYIEGTNLADEILRLGHLDEDRVLSIFSKVCEGLEHAHTNQIIHRDLKPSNIMLLRNERGQEIPKIVDFGIAKRQSVDNSVTQTGEIFGTPLYMSPEQCLGKAIDSRSDIYSLGCVMYEALAGAPPFVGSNPVETVLRHINDTPLPLRKACGDWKISPESERVVMACLEKDPKDRPESAIAVQRNLERIAQGEKPALRKAAHRVKKRMSKTLLFSVISFLLGGLLLYACLIFVYLPHRKTASKGFSHDYVLALGLEKQLRYKESIDVLLNAMKVNEGHMTEQQLLSCYLALVEDFVQLGDKNSSEKYFDKMMDLVKQSTDKLAVFRYSSKAGDTIVDPLRKIYAYEEASSVWSLAEPTKPDYLLHVLTNMIKQYRKLNMVDKASHSLQYAREIIEKYPEVSDVYKWQIADCSGLISLQMSQPSRALQYFRQAKELARLLKNQQYLQLSEKQEEDILKSLNQGVKSDTASNAELRDNGQENIVH